MEDNGVCTRLHDRGSVGFKLVAIIIKVCINLRKFLTCILFLNRLIKHCNWFQGKIAASMSCACLNATRQHPWTAP